MEGSRRAVKAVLGTSVLLVHPKIFFLFNHFLKTIYLGTSDGPLIKNPPCKKKKESTLQCKGHWFNPWSEKIPHAMKQLSLRATITEPEF